MKSLPLLAACLLLLSACAPKEQISKVAQEQKTLADSVSTLTSSFNELNQRLAQVEGAAKAKGPAPRWAVVDKNPLESRFSEWQRQRQAAVEPTYSPEVQAQISNHRDLLQKRQMIERKLMQAAYEQMRIQPNGTRHPFNMGPPQDAFENNADWVAANDEVNKAYKPIAGVMAEKAKSAQQVSSNTAFTVKTVLQEYGANKYDLILNKSYIDDVPYRADNEYVDITQGVMRLLERKIQEANAAALPSKQSQP